MKSKVFLLFLLLLELNVSQSLYAAADVKALNELYPGPYKLFVKSIEQKESIQARYESALLSFLRFNCSVNSSAPSLEYCDLLGRLEVNFSKRAYIIKMITDEVMSLGEVGPFINAIISSNFEFDFLVSENDVNSGVGVLIDYVISAEDRALTMKESALLLMSKGSARGANIKSTVLPMLYTQYSSVGILESVARYLSIADCSEGQGLCAFYLADLYELYSKMKDEYVDLVLNPMSEMIDHFENTSEDGPLGNGVIEQVWLRDVQRSYAYQDYHFLYELALTSAGHQGDQERSFKNEVIKVLILKKVIEDQKGFLGEKYEKWKAMASSYKERIQAQTSGDVYKEIFERLLINELLNMKKKTIDVIKGIDEEVLIEEEGVVDEKIS